MAPELDPCVCGPNHLPGYQHVEELSRVLVEIALEEGKLALSDSTRQRVVSAWNKLDLHDRSIQQFDSLYSARRGNALFGRSKGEPSESSLVQKLKFSKRYSAAYLLDSRKNRLMYCIIKQLWLHPDCGAMARGSPQKHKITKMYQRVQQRVTVDDTDLSKLGIPILTINSKCVAEFIRRQEALSATNVTDQVLAVLRRHQSVSSTSQPSAAELPNERPHTSRPQVQYEVTPSLAGTRKLKPRHDHFAGQPPAQLPVAPIQTACTFRQPTAPAFTCFLVVPQVQASVSLPQQPSSMISPARSTLYKRKKAECSGTGPSQTLKGLWTRFWAFSPRPPRPSEQTFPPVHISIHTCTLHIVAVFLL
ncbi:uncharacterized protein LOC119892239 [Micropterus salmoides]|uniref:uncharacterized protein LOC119892239 n=1 Tax=Micropterus salmoides TaxID=27706 RepID=UPI0018EDE910|nr:uncharacterized protein LOC119892239 [Micropterus salmoides]